MNHYFKYNIYPNPPPSSFYLQIFVENLKYSLDNREIVINDCSCYI